MSAIRRCRCHSSSLYAGLLPCPRCRHWSFDPIAQSCERRKCAYGAVVQRQNIRGDDAAPRGETYSERSRSDSGPLPHTDTNLDDDEEDAVALIGKMTPIGYDGKPRSPVSDIGCLSPESHDQWMSGNRECGCDDAANDPLAALAVPETFRADWDDPAMDVYDQAPSESVGVRPQDPAAPAGMGLADRQPSDSGAPQ